MGGITRQGRGFGLSPIIMPLSVNSSRAFGIRLRALVASAAPRRFAPLRRALLRGPSGRYAALAPRLRGPSGRSARSAPHGQGESGVDYVALYPACPVGLCGKPTQNIETSALTRCSPKEVSPPRARAPVSAVRAGVRRARPAAPRRGPPHNLNPPLASSLRGSGRPAALPAGGRARFHWGGRMRGPLPRTQPRVSVGWQSGSQPRCERR